MKKEMSYLNSYKFKNYNPANNRLPNKFPILTDLNSFSSFSTNIKNKTKSTNELTYSKNINLNNKSSSMTKNSKLSQYKNNKLYYVFQKPKEKNKNKYIWPKITQPKLPFSKRENITISFFMSSLVYPKSTANDDSPPLSDSPRRTSSAKGPAGPKRTSPLRFTSICFATAVERTLASVLG